MVKVYKELNPLEYVAAEHDINKVISDFIYPERIKDKRLIPIKRKAGIWQGQESYKDMEMLIKRDVTLKLSIPKWPGDLIHITSPDIPWAESHFQERIGGQPINPGETYKIWPYANFDKNHEFQKDEKFDHNYMERFWPKLAGHAQFDGLGLKNGSEYRKSTNQGIRFEFGDYEDVVKQLSDNTLTRQAFLPIFFPEDTGAKNNIRVPCTLGYLFEIFDGNLDMTYYIRSCDVFRHLRNDIYMAGRLVQHTRNLLLINGIEVRTGKLNMKIANLHVFENDLYALKKKESKLWQE